MEELGRLSGISLVCSNLSERSGCRPFAEEVYVDLGPLKLGVFALLSRSLGVETTYPELALEEPADCAARLVPRLAGRADLVVLLAHLPRNETQALLQRVGGIDLAIQGHGWELTSEPVFVGGSVLLAASNRGQVMGRLDLSAPESRQGRARLLWPNRKAPPETVGPGLSCSMRHVLMKSDIADSPHLLGLLRSAVAEFDAAAPPRAP